MAQNKPIGRKGASFQDVFSPTCCSPEFIYFLPVPYLKCIEASLYNTVLGFSSCKSVAAVAIVAPVTFVPCLSSNEPKVTCVVLPLSTLSSQLTCEVGQI